MSAYLPPLPILLQLPGLYEKKGGRKEREMWREKSTELLWNIGVWEEPKLAPH